MVIQVLHCPHCHGTDIVRHGTTRQGKQRYRCRTCPDHGRTFLLEDAYAGQSPDVKRQIVDAQFIGVCSSSILAEMLGYMASFSSHGAENGAFSSDASRSS